MSFDQTCASPAAIEHLRWALTKNVGPKTFARLIERFGSAQEALGASVAQLQTVEGIGPSLAEGIARGREEADVAAEVQLATHHHVRILCQDDADYPRLLRHISDPPICLYVRGTLKHVDAAAVAIVGSRRCTHYGREQAHRFGFQLGQRGLTVVSGLARGIDGESHKGALDAGGRTLAVLGNGLSRIYPPEHEQLAGRIADHGAVISALPMDTPPEASNFLPRNRLIAGLSLGVLVVEAAKRSGALSTAARACEYDREVFAVPGRLDSNASVGTHALIRDQHAKLVTNADDILDEFGEISQALSATDASQTEPADTQPAKPLAPLSATESSIVAVLDSKAQPVEHIAEKSGLPAPKVAGTLIQLQLKGLVRQMPGNLFCLIKR